jgi:hypothetical protein
MKAENLQEVTHAVPFRPFAIVFADGKQIVVRHPEWIVHQGRTAAVIEADERLHIIDVMLTQRLELDPPVSAGAIAPNPNGGE